MTRWCTWPPRSTWSAGGATTGTPTSRAPARWSPPVAPPAWAGWSRCRPRRWRTRAGRWSASAPSPRTRARPRVLRPLQGGLGAEALAADGPGLAVLAVRPHLVWGPGDTQLVARIVARARAGRLPVLGSGAALIDTTYVDNAATALVAAVDACGACTGRRWSSPTASRVRCARCWPGCAPPPGCPRHAAGPARRGPAGRSGRRGRLGGRPPARHPPLTRFLVEQLTTAHWFDQRRTREALGGRRRCPWRTASSGSRSGTQHSRRTRPAQRPTGSVAG